MPEIIITAGRYANSRRDVLPLRPCPVDNDEVFFPFSLGSGDPEQSTYGQVYLTEKELIEALEMLRVSRLVE